MLFLLILYKSNEYLRRYSLRVYNIIVENIFYLQKGNTKKLRLMHKIMRKNRAGFSERKIMPQIGITAFRNMLSD